MYWYTIQFHYYCSMLNTGFSRCVLIYCVAKIYLTIKMAHQQITCRQRSLVLRPYMKEASVYMPKINIYFKYHDRVNSRSSHVTLLMLMDKYSFPFHLHSSLKHVFVTVKPYMTTWHTINYNRGQL